jgi:transcriptional regulator with XRE-family HTH domain
MIKMVDNEQTKAAISANLKRLLKVRGMSQAALAKRIFSEVSTAERMMVYRWVNGKVAPDAADLLNLAEALSVTAEEIARQKKSKNSA